MKLALLTKDQLLSYLHTHTTPLLIKWLIPAKRGFLPTTGKPQRCFSLERSWEPWWKGEVEINFWFLTLCLPSLSSASFPLVCVSERTEWSFDKCLFGEEEQPPGLFWRAQNFWQIAFWRRAASRSGLESTEFFDKYLFEQEQHPGLFWRAQTHSADSL